MESTSAADELARRLARALALEVPYAERMLRPAERMAAVLALFGFSESGELSLLVTRRTDSVQSHAGQMAFPGGQCEPDEAARGDLIATALREAEEEVGIPRSRVRVVGALPRLTTVTLYDVTPVVAILDAPIEAQPLRIEPREVAGAYWIPWRVISDPATYHREMIERGAVRFPTHVYAAQGHRIWGATGAMIKNLLDRWAKIS